MLKFLASIGNKMSPKSLKYLIGAISAIVIIAIGISIWHFASKQFTTSDFIANRAFALTEESISQGADIQINVPDGQEVETAEISFDPKISGNWVNNDEAGKLIFHPEKNLEIGKYYAVTAKTDDGQIKSDFKVVEPPRIVNVFPKNESEANENSEITVIFNRPMVPLTTLDVLENFNIPIEIKPDTKGTWKWLGTRTLQFKPQDRLIGSANYTIKIKGEFISEDKLKVSGSEYKFYTRPLRYLGLTQEKIIYSQPIIIRFNQPVNLARTQKEISLRNITNDKNISFIAEYGTQQVWNMQQKKYLTEIDESTIAVFNKQDRHNRAKFWDFTNEYFLKINKAYPKNGNIVLDKTDQTQVKCTDIIKDISAESERTTFAALDFFDPQGKLFIEFFEDIDLNASNITADHMTKINYGEKCANQNPDTGYGEGVECEKIQDKSKIILEFDDQKVARGKSLNLELKVIKNLSGLQINPEIIKKQILTYPTLQITKMQPDEDELRNLRICSKTPLQEPDTKNEKISDYLEVSPEYIFSDWGKSWRVINVNHREICNVGEFETDISYLLAPNADYKINLQAKDVFGQSGTGKTNFHTGQVEDYYRNFYHFQDSYSATTPAKTKLTYAVENMEYADINICQVSALDMLTYLESSIDYQKAPQDIKNCQPLVNKRIDIPGKYWTKNYFQIKLGELIPNPLGHYILSFSHPRYIDYNKKQVFERAYLTVTNIGIVEKSINIDDYSNLTKKQNSDLYNLYWINELETLKPIDQAQVEVYMQASPDRYRELKLAGQTATDTNGIAKIQSVISPMGIIVTNGNDSAIAKSHGDSFTKWTEFGRNANRLFVYTDRPIYRPSDEIKIKGLYRFGYDGKLEIQNKEKVKAIIYNPEGKEIFSRNLDVNDFGTFNTDLILDSKSPLGQYRIETQNPEGGYAYFDVEEYVPAPFKIEAKTNKEEYISGDTLNLDVDAKYYFGVPLEGGKVTYSIGSQDFHFDRYQDDTFNFGGNWYDCWYSCDFSDKFITRNTVNLNSQGQAKIQQKLDLNKLFKKEEDRTSKIFVAYITVENLNGQSVTTQASFIVHSGEYYLDVKPTKNFLGKNEEFDVKVKSVDIQGKEMSVSNAKLTINKVSWKENRRQEVDGNFYYQWQKVLTQIDETSLSTNSNGNWDDNFEMKDEGEYEINVSGEDSRANKIFALASVYVYGNGSEDLSDGDLIKPANDNSLEITIDKPELEVGDTASFIVKNPFPKAKALIAIERGSIFEYHIIDIDQSIYKYEFPIKEDYIPNIYATVTLLNKDKNPSVRYGQAKFRVNTTRKKLNIEVKSSKENYLPGEEVQLNFSVKNWQNKPVETELSVAVVDLSVLALKGNPKENPLLFFYNDLPLTVITSSNVKNILQELDVPKGTKGGGGGDAQKKRGQFKDTAFWKAVLKTDANGQAIAKFKLPDNLTTWQVETIGITKDTKVGVKYNEFIARKELMLTPLKPRFVIPGDEIKIGAKIFNQSDKKQDLAVFFQSETLALANKDSGQDISIKSGETQTVYFDVTVPAGKQTGTHKFVLSAKNKTLEDTVEQVIKITRNDTYEATATSGYSKEKQVNEYLYIPENVVPDRGEVKISANATLAVFLSDAINYLVDYPYGCAEQIASKLETLAIVKNGLQTKNIGQKLQVKDIEIDGQTYTIDEAITLGLGKIYEKQNQGGGFGYFPNLNSDFYLTMRVVTALQKLDKAGIGISKQRLTRGLDYISRIIRSGFIAPQVPVTNNDLILAGFVLGQTNDDKLSYIAPKIKELISNDKYLNEESNNSALAYLAITTAQNPKMFGKDSKNKVYNTLENRLLIDARGAHIPESKTPLWRYYETGIKNTALYLQALIADNRDNNELGSILRWLLNSRSKDNAWETTSNTATAIDTFTQYLLWQDENNADFALDLLINDTEIVQAGLVPASASTSGLMPAASNAASNVQAGLVPASNKAGTRPAPTTPTFNFNKDNLLQQQTYKIQPLSKLPLNKLISLVFQKTDRNKKANNFYYDILFKYFLPIEAIAPRDEGFTITRNFYKTDDAKFEQKITQAKVGDILRRHIEIIVPEERHFVAIEDFIPAGVELINFNLSTENINTIKTPDTNDQPRNPYYYAEESTLKSSPLNPQMQELRDDRLFLFMESLNPGTYSFDYYARVLIPGKFHHLPAVISEMYFPENFGRTSGGWFEVE